jgi:hypothetical protein
MHKAANMGLDVGKGYSTAADGIRDAGSRCQTMAAKLQIR